MESIRVMGRGGWCPAYVQPPGLRGQWEGCVGSALPTGLCAGSGAPRSAASPRLQKEGHWQRVGRLGSLPGPPLLSAFSLVLQEGPLFCPAEQQSGLGSGSLFPSPPVGFLPHCFSFGFLALPLSVAPTPFCQIPSFNSFQYCGWLFFSCWDPEKSHLSSLFPGLRWRLSCHY